MKKKRGKSKTTSRIVSEFLNGYEEASTKRMYRGILNLFFEELKIKNPDTYFTSGRNYEQDLLDYWGITQKYANKTRVNKITTLRLFMEENNVVISRKVWKRIALVKPTRKIIDHVPTPAELKSILQHGGIKEKALFMTLATSGMRIGEALGIKLDDIQLWDHNHNLLSPAKIKIPGEIAKTGEPRITFISDETRDILIEWLKIREEYLHYAVIRLAKLHITKKLEDDRVFPFAWATAWNMWSDLLHRSRLDKKYGDTDRYEIHVHCLRKYFMNRMKGVTRIDAVEQIVGHSGYLDKSYRAIDEEELIRCYLQGMPSISIFQAPVDLSGINSEIERLKQEKTDQDKRIEELRALVSEYRLKLLEEKVNNGTKKT